MEPKKDELKIIILDVLDGVNCFLDKGTLPSYQIRTQATWYQTIYHTLTNGKFKVEHVYRRLQTWLDEDMQARVVPKIATAADSGNAEETFTITAKSFADFCTLLRFTENMLSYIDQEARKKMGYGTIRDAFFTAFDKSVYAKVKDKLRTVIIAKVNLRRDGNVVKMDELRSAIRIFSDVGSASQSKPEDRLRLYKQDFEDGYISHLVGYYTQKKTQKLQANALSHYVEWVGASYDLELTMAREMLRPTSEEEILKKLDSIFQSDDGKPPCVIEHPTAGFAALLEDEKYGPLKAMNTLFGKSTQNKHAMSHQAETHIAAKGKGIMLDAQQSVNQPNGNDLVFVKSLVEQCLEMQSKYKKIFADISVQEMEYGEAIRNAFTQFFNTTFEAAENKKMCTISEILSSYVDAVMKRELKDIVDSHAELDRIDQLATLFTYLKEKDVFQEYHTAKLAKRLLQTTPNEELEKAFIEKLQRVMGNGFTHKMEGMLHDRESTREMSDKFRDDAASRGLPIDLTCQVLTAGHWPAYRSDALVPTVALRQSMDAFTRFYKRTHATRTLSWIHMLGSATLSIAFPKGVKDVTCSIHQATILVLIDEAGKTTAQSLSAATKFDVQKGLKPHIQSMYVSKAFPVLVRVSESGEPMACDRNVSDADCFAINSAFTCKTRKFALPTLSSGNAGGSGMPTDAEVELHRRQALDACVVRVMKARHVLTYNELTQLVIDQLSKLFQAQPRHIKLRIEDLITRDFLKRDEKDFAKFHYVA